MSNTTVNVIDSKKSHDFNIDLNIKVSGNQYPLDEYKQELYRLSTVTANNSINQLLKQLSRVI